MKYLVVVISVTFGIALLLAFPSLLLMGFDYASQGALREDFSIYLRVIAGWASFLMVAILFVAFVAFGSL